MTLVAFVVSMAVATARAGGLVDPGDAELHDDVSPLVADAAAMMQAGKYRDAAGLYGSLADAGGGVAARVAEAVALYEAGFPRAARRAAEQALGLDKGNAAAANVQGLAMVDGGDVLRGLAVLEKAAARATSPRWRARLHANLGLARLDLGDRAGAGQAFAAARADADPGEDRDTLAAVAAGEIAIAAMGGTDQGVSRALGSGKLSVARAEAERARGEAISPRQRLEAEIVLAAVERAEGKLSAAATRLGAVVSEAREAGLAREQAVGLGALGLVQSLSGRQPIAADTLLAGVEVARAGGYRVVEVDLRCELGLVLIQLGRIDAAASEQREAGARLAGMDYPQGVARQAELGGAIAGARGDVATAEAALGRAAAHYAGLGRNLDAARAATALAAALEGAGAAAADAWARKAEGYFAAAGDRLGPAHVALARGLAQARARKLPEALAWMAKAAAAADEVGGGRGAALAGVAREDAAQALVMLGASQDVAAAAAQAGVGDLVERARAMEEAARSYDAGMAAYAAGDFEAARAAFQRSRAAFEGLAEPQYALRARRSAAWSVHNQLVALPVAQAAPRWQQLVEEAARVEDPELYARAYGAAALSAHATGREDLDARFTECARLAEVASLPEVGARCWGAMAEAGDDLEARARQARAAHALAPAEKGTVYALYAVAVDAYNAERLDLAVELGRLAKPNAGKLATAVDEVIAAASGGG